MNGGWHCACGGYRRFTIPAWNHAGRDQCWNCGRNRPGSNYTCPLKCGCDGYDLNGKKITPEPRVRE